MTSSLLIKNGHVIDPANGVDGVCDVLLRNGTVARVSENITDAADEVIDAGGLVVTPGLIDIQVHVREPGREDRETIETASWAALAGGVTSIVAMPNTTPVADNQAVIEFVIKRARELDLITVYPSGAITKGQKGEVLAEINEMKNSGAIAVTDDGVDVQNEGLLRRAMAYTKTCGLPLMSHCEVENLTGDGVMHEGWVSTQLALPGVPAAAEDLAVIKNIVLGRLCNARLHLLHNSTAGAAKAIREAKADGYANLTAEVSVQHFALTDEECFGYNTNAKMYPPLRSRDHVDAIIQAIKDDVFDAFTTDHAPHIEPEKLEPFEYAAYGSTGLETSFAVMHTYLVKAGHIPLVKGIEKMTIGPARVIGVESRKGSLTPGADADVAIFDIGREWAVDARASFSKGKNCIFDGKTLTGKAVCTITGGRVKYRDGKIVKPGGLS